MKKLFIAAIALAACVSANAQETYAPEAGEISTEIQFNPFSNDFGTFKLDQLKLRYMFSDKDAIRFGIGFGVDNHKVTPDPDENKDNWGKASSGHFSISLGYERHFFNYKRIDLYAGAGLGYKYMSASAKEHSEVNGQTFETKYCNIATIDLDNTNGIARTGHEFNVALFTGIDFYVYKGLFVGAEFGIKFACQSLPGYYTKGGFDDNGDWSASLESNKTDKESSISLKCFAEPALRIGWTF